MTPEPVPNPAPRETLRVQNFAGMTDVTLELSRMNVLIGPSASGKSVCAKLLYFFKDSLRRMAVDVRNGKTSQAVDENSKVLFLRYFPAQAWGVEPFEITYTFGKYGLTVQRETQDAFVTVQYSELYQHVLEIARTLFRSATTGPDYFAFMDVSDYLSEVFRKTYEAAAKETSRQIHNENWFIPAGRSFFSTFDGIVNTLNAQGITIDPFLSEFGSRYDTIRHREASGWELPNEQAQDYISRLLCGKYEREDNRDYIRMKDKRRIPIEIASSGQQETLPLALVLWDRYKRGFAENSTLFIEEPEAHLYPTAQRDVVHLMAAVTDLFSSSEGSQYVLTTHSPYILSALNNLMYGGKIVRDTPDKKDKVTAILPEQVLVDPAHVRAYMMEGGEATPIIDPKTGLIEAKQLDSASGIMLREFRQLLHVEFDNLDKGTARK